MREVSVQDWLKHGAKIHFRGDDGQPRYQVQVDKNGGFNREVLGLVWCHLIATILALSAD